MQTLFDAARRLQEFCEGHGWPHCFIGGVAVWRWGEPRFTRGVDLTLLAGFGGEEKIVDTFLAAYAPRVQPARDLFVAQRVMRLLDEGGIPLDVALGGLPFEELAVERARLFAFPEGPTLRICSAEDLVVMKAFAARPHDWVDVDSVVARHHAQLDWTYIYAQLAPLAEHNSRMDVVAELKKIQRQRETRR